MPCGGGLILTHVSSGMLLARCATRLKPKPAMSYLGVALLQPGMRELDERRRGTESRVAMAGAAMFGHQEAWRSADESHSAVVRGAELLPMWSKECAAFVMKVTSGRGRGHGLLRVPSHEDEMASRVRADRA